MNKEDLKIVIVDDSEFSCIVIQKMLNTAGFHNVSFYTHPVDFIEYYKKTEDVIDIIFIDYSMPDINGMNVLSYIKYKDKDIITVMVTGILDINLKQKAIELGVNEFMQKSIDYPEFKTKIDVLANLKLFQYREAQKNDELNTILKYKDAQENLAVQKQLKIINDELSFHYYNNIFIGSYFKPKDILSGDSYSAIKVDDDRLLFVIADGMGKGVSASLSSVLTVSFITYATKRSMQFNDFNFDRLIKDMFGYVKSIMLRDEAMSMVLIEYNTKTKNLKYANFGIPPIYIRTFDGEIEKIRPNNRPILMGSKEYNIDEQVINFQTFLVATDGLMESLMRNDRPYFTVFKDVFKKADSLREIIDDFYKYVEEADDDMTVFFMKIDDCDYEVIINEDVLLEPRFLEEYVNKLNDKFIEYGLEQKTTDKAVFALNELLLNAYEHTVVKISENKHKIIKNNEKIEYNGDEKFAKLKIIKNSTCLVIEIDDNGEGFDVNEVIKQELFNKYHGRGLKMINKLTNGIFYNQKGNNLKVYLKRVQLK